MRSNVTHMQPRAVRPAPEPLALYLRAGRNDHLDLMNLLSAGDTGCFGFVFEATQYERHKELKEQVLAHRLDAILDTKAMQLALPGGYTPSVAKLPWANKERMHTPADFQGLAGTARIGSLSCTCDPLQTLPCKQHRRPLVMKPWLRSCRRTASAWMPCVWHWASSWKSRHRTLTRRCPRPVRLEKPASTVDFHRQEAFFETNPS